MSDHAHTDSRGTVAELRALLDKASPAPWEASDTDEVGAILGGLVDPDMPRRGREIVGRSHHHAALIAALRNAAPDLLREDEFAQLVRRLCAEIRASWEDVSRYEARLTKSEVALAAIWKIAVNTPSRTVEAIGREHAESEAVLP